MIIALLAVLGVPLWVCAIALLTLVFRNRALRTRPGNVPVRMRAKGSGRWRPGHAVWIHDVVSFRGSPAAWSERLLWVTGVADVREASAEERKRLRRIGDRPIVATLSVEDGTAVEMAARAEHRDLLLGHFAAAAARA